MMQLDSGERKVPFHFLVLVIMYRALLFASQGDLRFPYVLKQIVALLPWFFPCTTIAWTQHWSTIPVGSNLKLWLSSWRIQVVLLEPCPRELALARTELGASYWLMWASLVHSTTGTGPAASASTPFSLTCLERRMGKREQKQKGRGTILFGGMPYCLL